MRLASARIGTTIVDGVGICGRWWPLAETAKRLRLNALAAPTITLFEAWPRSLAALLEFAERAPAEAADISCAIAECEFDAPLRYPGKVVCAGANYYDHLSEMGMADTRKEAQRLFFFFKPPRTAIVGPGPSVLKPADSRMFDWEVELAVVFGERLRNVSETAAAGAIAALTIAIDLSARDLNTAPETFYKLDWVAGKAQDTSCPMGPFIVPAAFIPDPMDLALSLSVNGVRKQDARTSGMIFSIPEQIARLSRIMTIEPGDVLLTGTPAGVGFPQRTFLSVGDRLDAEIEGIGRLSVTIAGEV